MTEKKKKATKKKKKEEVSEEPAPLKEEAVSEEPGAFVEGNHETHMTFDHGGMPRYIAAVWVIFLIGSAMYYYRFGVPDLTAWGAP